jgi:hypothetical protein
MTPAGSRVDPEVYCRYAMSGPAPVRTRDRFLELWSSESTVMTVGSESVARA